MIVGTQAWRRHALFKARLSPNVLPSRNQKFFVYAQITVTIVRCGCEHRAYGVVSKIVQIMPNQGRYEKARVWPVELKLHGRVTVLDVNLKASSHGDD